MSLEVRWKVKMKRNSGAEMGCIAVQAALKKGLVTPLKGMGSHGKVFSRGQTCSGPTFNDIVETLVSSIP